MELVSSMMDLIDEWPSLAVVYALNDALGERRWVEFIIFLKYLNVNVLCF